VERTLLTLSKRKIFTKHRPLNERLCVNRFAGYIYSVNPRAANKPMEIESSQVARPRKTSIVSGLLNNVLLGMESVVDVVAVNPIVSNSTGPMTGFQKPASQPIISTTNASSIKLKDNTKWTSPRVTYPMPPPSPLRQGWRVSSDGRKLRPVSPRVSRLGPNGNKVPHGSMVSLVSMVSSSVSLVSLASSSASLVSLDDVNGGVGRLERLSLRDSGVELGGGKKDGELDGESDDEGVGEGQVDEEDDEEEEDEGALVMRARFSVLGAVVRRKLN
ncbi:hypothetical protein HDU76_008895, partial [Blyttiomyces sp. JEL0837]